MNLSDNIDKEETIQEVSYKYNIGFEEMVGFYDKASQGQIKQMEKLVKNNDWNGFKKLIKNVIGVNLKG